MGGNERSGGGRIGPPAELVEEVGGCGRVGSQRDREVGADPMPGQPGERRRGSGRIRCRLHLSLFLHQEVVDDGLGGARLGCDHAAHRHRGLIDGRAGAVDRKRRPGAAATDGGERHRSHPAVGVVEGHDHVGQRCRRVRERPLPYRPVRVLHKRGQDVGRGGGIAGQPDANEGLVIGREPRQHLDRAGGVAGHGSADRGLGIAAEGGQRVRRGEAVPGQGDALGAVEIGDEARRCQRCAVASWLRSYPGRSVVRLACSSVSPRLPAS